MVSGVISDWWNRDKLVNEMMECRIPEKFDEEQENLALHWKKFIQRFDIFLKATGKDNTNDEGKIAILLNIGGDSLLEIYNTLGLSQKKKYEEVKTELDKHFEPVKNVIYERYKFLSHPPQSADQNIESYVLSLKKLVKNCEYHVEEKDNMIRDKLVMGVKDSHLRCRLLDESKLTLDQAVGLAKKFHTVRSQTSDMSKVVLSNKEDKYEKEVDFVRKKGLNHQDECNKCGRTHYNNMICPAVNGICNYCQKRGHFASKCLVKNQQSVYNNRPKYFSKDFRDHNRTSYRNGRQLQSLEEEENVVCPRRNQLEYSNDDEYQYESDGAMGSILN